MTKRYEEQMELYISMIEGALARHMSHFSPTKRQGDVSAAMEYSLSAGGKRIRPILAVEFCRICGGDVAHAMSAAAAIEMIHTFSLIHDDMPCMDDDDLRRGKPACHKVYGEATALLAGVALENLAVEILANDEIIADDVKIKLIRELTRGVGVDGMIGGQMIDIRYGNAEMTETEIREMYACKTGALITAACRMGAICAKASEEKLIAATKFSEKLGLAFQIVDDILDVSGTTTELGKAVGRDAGDGKITYVGLFGIEKSVALAETLTNEALGLCDAFDDNDFLKELTKSLVGRKC